MGGLSKMKSWRGLLQKIGIFASNERGMEEKSSRKKLITSILRDLRHFVPSITANVRPDLVPIWRPIDPESIFYTSPPPPPSKKVDVSRPLLPVVENSRRLLILLILSGRGQTSSSWWNIADEIDGRSIPEEDGENKNKIGCWILVRFPNPHYICMMIMT